MARKNKYIRSLPFHSWAELYFWLRDGKWVYLDYKVMHPTFIMGMPYRTVRQYFDQKRIYKAMENE